MTKLKASALFYAMLIATLIGIISGSLILFAYLNNLLFLNFDINQKLLLNAASGIEILKGRSMDIGEEPTKVQLFDQEEDEVELSIKPWGAFEIATSIATANRAKEIKVAQMGWVIKDNIALYLTDNNRPLALCGNTIIKGDCYLPKAGTKRAYIEGKSFVGQHLINGNTKKSNTKLPEISPEFLSQIQYYLTKSNNQKVSEEFPDSALNSFSQPTQYLISVDDIIIDQYYKGNVVIISEQDIVIRQDAVLEDVLIYANNIIVERHFKGNVQLIAKDRIKIESDVALQYPSVLALMAERITTKNTIEIDQNTNISGIVFLNKSESLNKELRLRLEKNAMIEGIVYVKGEVELKGKIHGTLYCDNFHLKTPSSIYQNHILDGVIDYSLLSDNFVGSVLNTGSNKHKSLVKWLF